MESGVLSKKMILSDSNGQRYIIGSPVGVNGITESYEAALYDGKEPTDFPAILHIIQCEDDKPLPHSFEFYMDHARPNDLDNWRRTQHLGIPALLGTGIFKNNDQNYSFIIIERHGKDLWSLFSEHNRKFEAHTVYKITLQMIIILKYTHAKNFIQGYLNSSNIVVDAATQNHIYLLDDSLPSYAVSVDQVDPQLLLKSRDTEMGVSTARGDMETLFYNMVQWLGIELPWEKNCSDPSLVLIEKINAFKDVDMFLRNWSKGTSIPVPVCEFMKLLGQMDSNHKPKYHLFNRILVNGLRQLYHVPSGKLEFSISNISIVDSAEHRKPMMIPNLGISVEKMAKIISENCRHECEVRLRDIGPGSLIEIVCKLTCKKKSNRKWQNILANAWEHDTAGLKTMVESFWREKALQVKGNTNEATPTETEHEVPRQDLLTFTAGAPAPENTNNGLNHNNPGTSNSQSRCEAMTPDGMPPNEHSVPLDFPNLSSPNVRPAACPPSPSRSPRVQNSPHRPSTSGYSSRSSMADDSHLENMSSSRTSEQFSDTEHYERPEVVVVKVERKTKRAEVQVIECRSSESAGCESWQDKYKMLDVWLKMKEQNFDALGSIPSEPQMVADQVQQVRVLLDELYRSLRLRHLKNAKLPSDPADAQEHLESQLEEIECRWWDLQERLEKRGRQLGDACYEKLRDALQAVSNNLNQLPLDNVPVDQQLSKIEKLSGELKDMERTLLANATTVTEQLCQSVKTKAHTSHLRVQLRSVNNLHSDLQQKIAIKKAEVESSSSDGQLDDTYTETREESSVFARVVKQTHEWLVEKLENITKKLLVSTDCTELQQQLDNYKREHQYIMDRETEVMELLERGRVRSLTTMQQKLKRELKPLWDLLVEASLKIVKNLETCIESSNKFDQSGALFLLWLGEAESRFKGIKPASLDDIAKELKEFYVLRDEVHEKLSEFKQYVNFGHAFRRICDIDTDDVVKNKLNATKNRWTKLNHDLLNYQKSFEDMDKNFAGFNRSLLELQKKITQHEKELTAHDALGAAAKDSQFLPRRKYDHFKELKTQTVSLKEPLDIVRQQAKNLVLQSRKQGIDASHLLDGVKNEAVRIDNLVDKYHHICNEIPELENARFVKEVQEDKPVESRNSKKQYSERSRNRDSEPNGPRRDKKKSDSPSRKRSRSKDSSKNSEGSKIQKNDKNEDSKPESDRDSSRSKRYMDCKDSGDSDRDSLFRNSRTPYESNRSPWRSSNYGRPWHSLAPRYPYKSQSHYKSNKFQNFEQRARTSHFESLFGRNIDRWRTAQNRGWNFHQNQPFKMANRVNSAYRQATTARDMVRDREPNAAGEQERRKGDMSGKYAKSGNELKQSENTKNPLQESDSRRVNEPLVDEDDRNCEQLAVEKEDQQKAKK